jgi:hypothetical protein
VSIICAAICGVVASAKGRNVLGWTLLGLLGLIPVIILACLPNAAEQEEREAHIAEENRRLREQLRQERIKSETFRQHAAARLDVHDQHLGIDTRAAGPRLAGGAPPTAQLGAGTAGTAPPGADTGQAHWYYGRDGRTIGPAKMTEIEELIRLQIITEQTLVWSEDMADWRAAGELAVFAGQF